MKTTPIEYPLIIVHQPGGAGNSIRTIIANDTKEPFDHCAFGMIICDVIRHVAQAFGVRDKDVYEWVKKEFERPTSEVETVWQMPRGNA